MPRSSHPSQAGRSSSGVSANALTPAPPAAGKRRSGEAIVIRLLACDDLARLDTADGELLRDVDPRVATAWLGDPRRHVAIALAGARVVGIAFASHRFRARGAPELVVGDVTVASAYRRRGVGRRLLALLLARGRSLGCREAVAEAERDNAAMRRLCAGMGGVELAEPTVRVSFPLA